MSPGILAQETIRILAQEKLREWVWHSFAQLEPKLAGLGSKYIGKFFAFSGGLEPPAGIEPATC